MIASKIIFMSMFMKRCQPVSRTHVGIKGESIVVCLRTYIYITHSFLSFFFFYIFKTIYKMLQIMLINYIKLHLVTPYHAYFDTSFDDQSLFRLERLSSFSHRMIRMRRKIPTRSMNRSTECPTKSLSP